MLPIFKEENENWLCALVSRIYSKTLADIWDTEEEEIESCLLRNAIEIVDKEKVAGKKYVVLLLMPRLSVTGLHTFCYEITDLSSKRSTYKPDICKSPTFREDFEKDLTAYHSVATS